MPLSLIFSNSFARFLPSEKWLLILLVNVFADAEMRVLRSISYRPHQYTLPQHLSTNRSVLCLLCSLTFPLNLAYFQVFNEQSFRIRLRGAACTLLFSVATWLLAAFALDASNYQVGRNKIAPGYLVYSVLFISSLTDHLPGLLKSKRSWY